MITDLESLKSKRDMFFINKVLLPLIKNEEAIPVCLIDSSSNQELDIGLDYSNLSQDQKH